MNKNLIVENFVITLYSILLVALNIKIQGSWIYFIVLFQTLKYNSSESMTSTTYYCVIYIIYYYYLGYPLSLIFFDYEYYHFLIIILLTHLIFFRVKDFRETKNNFKENELVIMEEQYSELKIKLKEALKIEKILEMRAINIDETFEVLNFLEKKNIKEENKIEKKYDNLIMVLKKLLNSNKVHIFVFGKKNYNLNLDILIKNNKEILMDKNFLEIFYKDKRYYVYLLNKRDEIFVVAEMQEYIDKYKFEIFKAIIEKYVDNNI